MIGQDEKGRYFSRSSDKDPWTPAKLSPDGKSAMDNDTWKPLPGREDRFIAQTGDYPNADEPGGGMLPVPRSLPPGGLVDTSVTPGENVGNLLPLSKDDAGNVRFALPNPVRALITEGPQVQRGQLTVPAVVPNEEGQPRLTPEAQAAGSAASPLRFSGATPLMRLPQSPLTLTRPLPVTLEELTAAIDRAGPPRNRLAPESAAPSSAPTAAPSSGTWVPMEAGMTYPEGWQTRINRDTGRPEVFDATRGAQAPPSASAPTSQPQPSAPLPGGPSSTPSQPAAAPGASGATTSAASGSNEAILANAKSVADQHYGIAKASGQDAAYTPQSVGKMVDAVDSAAPQGPGERAVGGENAVTRLQRDMQPLRDQSLTLADIQRMDERMSDHITEEYRAGRNKVAGQLEDIQDKWREQADNATEADVTGGAAGFQALDPARKAWAQYRKMSDVMLMKQRADMTQNPTTSYKTAVKNFVTSKKSRGWTDEEKADLVASADRGVIGGTLHLLGSRLLPHVGGAVGASVGGIPGFIAGEVVTHGLGAGARSAANAMQDRRVNRAMGTLGGSVPAPPTNELLLR